MKKEILMSVVQMAASTSANRPQSDCHVGNKDSKQRLSKGKEKAKPLSTQSVELEDATPWNWTSLTDPFSGRVPSVFSKDGR